MTPYVNWDAECPPEVRAAAEPLLAESRCLLPRWLLELRLGWRSECEGAAESRVNPEYRWARINLAPGWLETEPVGRRETFLHEVVHIYLQGLANCAHATIDAADLPTAAQKIMREQVRVALEGATCDLTFALLHACDEVRV